MSVPAGFKPEILANHVFTLQSNKENALLVKKNPTLSRIHNNNFGAGALGAASLMSYSAPRGQTQQLQRPADGCAPNKLRETTIPHFIP